MSRHAIRDLFVPTAATMTAIPDALDASLAKNEATYAHCWGGASRTGMVIGCCLLRHGLAISHKVLDVRRNFENGAMRTRSVDTGRRRRQESSSGL